jgi:hypothetical protein
MPVLKVAAKASSDCSNVNRGSGFRTPAASLMRKLSKYFERKPKRKKGGRQLMERHSAVECPSMCWLHWRRREPVVEEPVVSEELIRRRACRRQGSRTSSPVVGRENRRDLSQRDVCAKQTIAAFAAPAKRQRERRLPGCRGGRIAIEVRSCAEEPRSVMVEEGYRCVPTFQHQRGFGCAMVEAGDEAPPARPKGKKVVAANASSPTREETRLCPVVRQTREKAAAVGRHEARPSKTSGQGQGGRAQYRNKY